MLTLVILLELSSFFLFVAFSSLVFLCYFSSYSRRFLPSGWQRLRSHMINAQTKFTRAGQPGRPSTKFIWAIWIDWLNIQWPLQKGSKSARLSAFFLLWPWLKESRYCSCLFLSAVHPHISCFRTLKTQTHVLHWSRCKQKIFNSMWKEKLCPKVCLNYVYKNWWTCAKCNKMLKWWDTFKIFLKDGQV